MGDKLSALDAQAARNGKFAVSCRLRSEIFARCVTRIDLERIAHKDVAAGAVDIAADGHEVAHGKVQSHGAHLLVERKAPLDSRIVARSVQAGGTGDILFFHAGDFGSPCRRHIFDTLPKLVKTACPAVHELLVVKRFRYDDVEPSASERRVGARTELQEIGGTSTPPSEARIDGYYLRPHLHALNQPMPYVAVGVRRKRLVAPYYDYFRSFERRVGVALFVRHRSIRNGKVAQRRHGAAHARHVASEARKEQR